MICRYPIDDKHLLECRWSTWSGAERYFLDGKEFARQRSFSWTGRRHFELDIDGQPRSISIHLRYRLSLSSIWNNAGLVAELQIDDEIVAQDLLSPPYRTFSLLHKVATVLPVILLALLLLVFVDGRFLASRLFGVGPDDLPESLRIINASVATDRCRQALDNVDESVLLSPRDGRALRESEMHRQGRWRLNDHATALSVITAIYEMQPQPCRQSMMELIDRYLDQGADINQRFSARHMTVLESAILAGDADLSCELLRRGASLEQRVQAKRSDGAGSPITGVSLDVLAQKQAEKFSQEKHLRTMEVIQNFKDSGHCRTGKSPISRKFMTDN